MSEASVAASFDASLLASRELSHGVLQFLARRSPEAQAKWAQASVEAGRVIFQPWSMEIVFVLAIAREARFGELQHMLGGISSRTLSDKLQTLREEGLVEREVFDEQPVRIRERRIRKETPLAERTGGPRPSVRIAYRLTKEGRMTASLATPLFAHLNHRKM